MIITSHSMHLKDHISYNDHLVMSPPLVERPPKDHFSRTHTDVVVEVFPHM